ncbi:MAG: cysteine hydrolase [Propionibacteriaceae bacterium]|jgi:nicotinamidase-related amidase|nr:cysteine hydrolase [Propionibacteriaceae bacterium]
MKALIIIDIQNDYFPGGRFPLVNPENAADRASAALNAFRQAGLPVIHVQHINTHPDATFFLSDTSGADIHPSVRALPDEPVVIKHVPNSFTDTGLADLLNQLGVTELVICGMMTHMCIDTSVRAAKDHKFPVTLLHDACATRDLEFNKTPIPADQVQAAFMAALSGMFARLSTTDEAIAELTIDEPGDSDTKADNAYYGSAAISHPSSTVERFDTPST